MSVKGQGRSLILDKVHSALKVKSWFFSNTVGSFETKPVKDESTAMKIYINGLDHMTKMVATLIYGKTL